MCCLGVFKRVVPFLLTFAAGLFIASFFVSIVPNFDNWRETRRSHRCREKQQIRMEMDELRDKIRTLRQENQELRRTADSFELAIPEIPAVDSMEAPHPPAPPKRPKHPRFE